MEVSTLPRPSGGTQLRSPRLLRTFGDDRLVDQLRLGNDAAFEVMYDRHHRGILSFCRHMLRSREEAEDAVQQTFISAHADLRASDKDIRLKAWLYTIARNRCLSVLRARREQTAELQDIPIAGFADEVAQRDDLRRLLADMHELPEDQRAALVLSELGDLSHSEIAGVVGCDPMKVKSLVFQARSSLIESRDAREIPCEEIREQLATLTGGALRRGPLRRHVKSCEACTEFRDQVRDQRGMVAALLPIVPTIGLKHGILASAGMGSGGAAGIAAGAGGATAGGLGAAASGGATVSSIAGASAAKLAIVAVLATGTVGGGVAITSAVGGNDASAPAASSAPSTVTPAGHASGASKVPNAAARARHHAAARHAAAHGGRHHRSAHAKSDGASSAAGSGRAQRHHTRHHGAAHDPSRAAIPRHSASPQISPTPPAHSQSGGRSRTEGQNHGGPLGHDRGRHLGTERGRALGDRHVGDGHDGVRLPLE